MKYIFYSILVAIILVGCRTTAPDLQIAKGWRSPTKTEVAGGWEIFAKPDRPAYLAQADFNGDGILDVAYIALATRGKAWALFVNLNSTTSRPEIIKLDEDRGETPPQTMGVSVAEPGKYKTACGKGYWKCERGEPAELELKLPGIDYGHFESADSFYWWDRSAENYVRTWMSD